MAELVDHPKVAVLANPYDAAKRQLVSGDASALGETLTLLALALASQVVAVAMVGVVGGDGEGGGADVVAEHDGVGGVCSLQGVFTNCGPQQDAVHPL